MTSFPVLPLGSSAVNRNAIARSNPTLIQDLKASSATRYLVLNGSDVLLHETSPGLRLKLIPGDALSPLDDEEHLYYLGETAAETLDADGTVLPIGTSVVAAAFAENTAQLPAGTWHNLRRVSSALTELDAGLFSQALALSNWHRGNRHCPKCGAQTIVQDAGWSRGCPACGKQTFPRTDPAIIVAVTDEQDRILLGSQGSWESNRWSVLAGFVEAGESLNSAVEREILEEAGIEITDITFVGSQPWPFPYSLMFGFTARVKPGQEVVPDGEEIVRLRWFSRDELRAERSEISLPGKLSIARALIEQWLGSTIDEVH